MVQHKHFKSRVRDRMATTGESYTTARRHLLATRPENTPTIGQPGGPSVSQPDSQYDAALWQRVLARAGVLNPATGAPFSEALLAGLAGGIGFMVATFSYESITTATVVLRAHPEPYTERLLDRCGAPIERLQTGSAKVAQASLDRALDAGRPVVVRATHGALPWIGSETVEYLDSIEVAVLGRIPGDAAENAGAYLVDGGGASPGEEAGDDVGPHLALPAELAAARAARKSDKHWAAWVVPGGTEDTGGTTTPAHAAGAHAGQSAGQSAGPATGLDAGQLADNVRAAVAETTGRMLGTLPLEGIPAGWASKFGVAGMRTWAGLLRDDRTKKGWPALFAAEDRLRTGLQMVQGFLAGSRWGGAGGLRGLYADFLTEASDLPGLGELAGAAAAYRDLAPRWDALADVVNPEVAVGDRAAHFAELAGHLDALADREEQAARGVARAAGVL